jgi:hypothetical protein
MRNTTFLLLLSTLLCSVPAANADFWANRNPQNLNPAFGTPGANVQPGQGVVNPYYYQNLPGTGYYRGYGFSPGYNWSGSPVAVVGSGGYFSFRGGPAAFRFWQAPSGYYYPWYSGLAYQPQILVFQQGSQNPSPAQPPVTTVISDMRSFLDQSKSSGKLSEEDYSHLSRRLNDVQGKYYSDKINAGGSLDDGQEADVRKQIDMVGEELVHRLKT